MSTKRVWIHSLWSKREASDRVFTYVVQVPDGTTVQETLENAYCATNVDNRPNNQKVAATSVGDILLADGQHWLVDVVGFRKLTPQQANSICQNLTSRETSFGYDHLVKEGLL